MYHRPPKRSISIKVRIHNNCGYTKEKSLEPKSNCLIKNSNRQKSKAKEGLIREKNLLVITKLHSYLRTEKLQ